MSGELAPKIRVVRCPKCRLLLPESPEYDVYKCGGCGTTLKAKKRKSVAVNSESSGTHEQLVPSRENGLSAKATTSSSGECSLDGNGKRAQNENGECNGELLGPFNLSDEELENEMDTDKLSLRRRRVSNEGCPNELTHSETKASSELREDTSVEEANDTNSQLAGVEELNDGNSSVEGAKEELICAPDEDGNNEKSALAVVGVKSEVEIAGKGAEELNNGNLLPEGVKEELISGSGGEDANNDKSALVGANPEVEITGTDVAGAKELNKGQLFLEKEEEELKMSTADGEAPNNDQSVVAGAEELNNGQLFIGGEEEDLNMCTSGGEAPNNDQSVLVSAKSEVDITGTASPPKSSGTEKLVPENGRILSVTACTFEEGTSANSVSSPNAQQKQAQKHIHHSFDHVRSMDTFDTSEVINPSSDLGELCKSPTTRSSYAYDGSVSSDGMDEQFSTQHLDSFENAYTVANGVSEGRHRKGKSPVNSMLYGDLETQQSYLSNGKHHVMKDSRGNQKKVLETTSHGHRHWMRTKRDEFPSRMPFHRSGSQSGYEIGSPSNRMHDELYCSSTFLSPDSREDTDQEKIKLLRMIYKLQDQLNRMSVETNGRPSTSFSYPGKHISAYHSHDLLHEGRFYHGVDYPPCNGRCSHGINWRQRHKFPQIPYSAEATTSTNHVDRSCLRCCPQEWHCSANLPPRVLFQHEEFCRSHLGYSRCSSHCSYPSSPQWFTASELPVYGLETKSDDQRHRAPEVKNYFREKQNLGKRHYRPVAGGAPFVTCYHCSKLLQLPADFLLFKRVCHQLKCGACSAVLKFSLQNGSHIISYSPNAIAPPSNGLNDQSEVINSSNLPSASHANYYHNSSADPISYSDDYGLSVSKSYSSEGDPPVSLTQFHPLNGSEYDNTFEPIADKEKIASRHSDSGTGETPVKADESAGLPSNMPSEMKARSPPKSSSLHVLMGYSSPSQVIRGKRSSSEGGKESTPDAEKNPSQEREL